MKLALISMNLSDHFLYGEPGKEGGTPGIHGTVGKRYLWFGFWVWKGDRYQGCLKSRSEWAPVDGSWA